MLGIRSFLYFKNVHLDNFIFYIRIFSCSQFLHGYVNIPILKDVEPEDIEDVSNQSVHMFTEERNSDVVKKVRLKEDETSFYLISFIEHKSRVDYNVIMQILRYIVYIWEDYERE